MTLFSSLPPSQLSEIQRWKYRGWMLHDCWQISLTGCMTRGHLNSSKELQGHFWSWRSSEGPHVVCLDLSGHMTCMLRPKVRSLSFACNSLQKVNFVYGHNFLWFIAAAHKSKILRSQRLCSCGHGNSAIHIRVSVIKICKFWFYVYYICVIGPAFIIDG